MLIGIVSASVIPYLSNTLTGNVEVTGPVFYLDSEDVLALNEKPLESDSNKIQNIETRNYVMKDEDSLEGIDFYDPEIEFVIDIEVSDLTKPRAVDLEFGFIKTNKDARPICSTLFLNIEQNKTYYIPCNNIIYSPQDVDKFYFSISGRADEPIDYFIKTRDSYIKILGVAPWNTKY